jgi:hypothetical protein
MLPFTDPINKPGTAGQGEEGHLAKLRPNLCRLADFKCDMNDTIAIRNSLLSKVRQR